MPLVPVVLLLVAALLLSRSEPVSVLLHGLVFGVVALVWLRVRGGQTELADSAPDPGRSARVLGAAAMVAVGAMIATLVVGTSSGTDRQVLRGLLPAYDVAQAADARSTTSATTRSASRRPTATSSTDELLLVEGAPAGTRIRFAALDTYDGTHWAADNDTDPERTDDRFLRLSTTIDNPADGARGRDRDAARRRLGAALAADRRRDAGLRLPRRGLGRREGGPPLRPRDPDRGDDRRSWRPAPTT